MSAKWCAIVFGLVGSVVFGQSTVSTTAAVQMPYPGVGTTLGAQIDALLAEPNAARDHWGVAVTALDGTPIYGHDEGQLFRPASNAKIFTTIAAMSLLGPDRVEKTSVSWHRVVNGTVSELRLDGNGDANLSDTQFPYRTPAQRKADATTTGKDIAPPDPLRYIDELAAAVASNGIQHVTGDIVGFDGMWSYDPYPEAWGIDDMTWGYGAPVSALTIEDNELELKVTAGAKVGEKAVATITPDIGYYQIDMAASTVAAKASANMDVLRDPGSKVLRIVGTVAMDSPYTTELAIADPAEFAAQALKKKLQEHGVIVDGIARAQHQLVPDAISFYRESHQSMEIQPLQKYPSMFIDYLPSVTHTSPTLAEDIVYTLKVSQNLHAEMMLRKLGQMFGESPLRVHSTSAEGARVIRQFLINAGLDGNDFLFFDGSGLSAHDLVAPRATAKLLSYATTQPWFAAWKSGLPVGGEDGTLKARFPEAPLKDHVFAKTGTLGESRALSGYVDCASGKQVIFSIMVDDHSPGTAADRTTMDKIVAAIAANN
jgi:D-alanyl-D-alanine carboxypeptidase/D-alanyl-D-alanine-endopeptidase (penicillin-binding protein 4)